MQLSSGNKNRVLSTFSLVMINVIAVDSLRTLPIGAEYGTALIFFYLVAGFCFFIPIALVSAELATGWPNLGGIYVWVTQAFGARMGFMVIWLQWIYNVVWYPTILSFITGTLAYLIDPALAQNKYFMLASILTLFWLTTLVNSFGMRLSSMVSLLGTIFGTMLPMLFIIALGVIWVLHGNATAIDFTWQSFLPSDHHQSNLAFFIAIVFGLIGIEMSAVHAEEVRNPARDYPRALLYSTVIILLTLMFSSLAIAIVVPHENIDLTVGIMQAFDAFFEQYQMQFLKPVMAFLIVFGSLACVSAWVIGPTKGLWAAKQDGCLPPILQKMTKQHVPIAILILQGILFTLICSVFVLMPTVSSSYWLLTDLTGELALIVYIVLFAAAIRLRYKAAQRERAFRVPGGNIGIWIVGLIGIITSVITMGLGLIPPKQIDVGGVWVYEALLLSGIVLLSLPPFIIYACRKAHWLTAE